MAVRRTPPNFGDNLGIVDANYPQKATNINQLVKHKTLILQGITRLCQTLQKAVFLTTDQKAGGSNLSRRARKDRPRKTLRGCLFFSAGTISAPGYIRPNTLLPTGENLQSLTVSSENNIPIKISPENLSFAELLQGYRVGVAIIVSRAI